jgi:hypothetical protein
MTLVLVLVPVWLLVVGCVIAMFRIAARGDDVFAAGGRQPREPSSELPQSPDVALPAIRIAGRGLYVVPRS